MGKMAPER